MARVICELGLFSGSTKVLRACGGCAACGVIAHDMKFGFLKLTVVAGVAALFSGCEAYKIGRIENPKLALPIADPSRAELVGFKIATDSEGMPDRVTAKSVNGVEFKDKPGDWDDSESLHAIPIGKNAAEVLYTGMRWKVKRIIPSMPFGAMAEIPFEAQAGVRYQVRGSLDGDFVWFWIVRLPEGTHVTVKTRAEIFDMTLTGDFRLRENAVKKSETK